MHIILNRDHVSLFVCMVSMVLEEDESGSATCWFKDDDDDATIAWSKILILGMLGEFPHLVPLVRLC